MSPADSKPPPHMGLRIVAALASGAVLILISPPANLHFLHWFSFLPLFWALSPDNHKENALLGYAAGWMGVFSLFFWLVDTVVIFSSLPWVLGLATHLLFTTVFALPYALVFGSVHWFRKRMGLGWLLLVPALQVAVEKLSPALFPYYHGASHYRVLWAWQLTSVIGVMGVSFLVFLTNAALAEALYRRQEGRNQPWKAHGLVALVFLANLGFGIWRSDRIDSQLANAPKIRVALLQQNTTMEVRLEQPAAEALQTWIDVTEKVMDQRPDLVVWPEGSVSFNPHSERKTKRLAGMSPRELFETLSKSGDFDLLVGGGTLEVETENISLDSDEKQGRRGDITRRYTSYNSCYLFRREGGLSGRYDKMIPLPFGEYVPFSDTFPFLKDIITGPGDFRSGSVPTIFEGSTASGVEYTFSVPICYEAILESQMRLLSEADLFVNITNDAWFGDTACPHQHAALSAVQATQFGRPMLRIAYTGISFIVEPHGRILHQTTPYTEVTTVEELRLLRVETPYSRGGWLFPWACVVFVLGGAIAARRRGSEKAA